MPPVAVTLNGKIWVSGELSFPEPTENHLRLIEITDQSANEATCGLSWPSWRSFKLTTPNGQLFTFIQRVQIFTVVNCSGETGCFGNSCHVLSSWNSGTVKYKYRLISAKIKCWLFCKHSSTLYPVTQRRHHQQRVTWIRNARACCFLCKPTHPRLSSWAVMQQCHSGQESTI